MFARALDLCKRAIAGRLSLEELGKEWPAGETVSEVLSLVREDILDAVEHFPGKLWTGKPNWETWEDDEARRVLVVDAEVIEGGEKVEDVEKRRRDRFKELGIRGA